MKYTAQVTFETDRPLSRPELINLLTAVELQVQEPMDETGNDEEYRTKNISGKLEIHTEDGVYILQ